MYGSQVRDDERDDVVEQVNLHGNFIERMDGLEAFSGCVSAVDRGV